MKNYEEFTDENLVEQILSGDSGELFGKPFPLHACHGHSRHCRYRHNAMIRIIQLTKNLYATAELADIALFHQNFEEIEQIRIQRASKALI